MLKRAISGLFFLPLFLFLALIFINKDALFTTIDINIFWFYSFKQIPVILWLTFFFSGYILLIWILMKFSDIFSGMKTTKMSSEINELKAKLHDAQGDLIKTLTEEFFEVIKSYRDENEKNISILKKENEKTLSQVIFEIKGIKEHILNTEEKK